MIIITTVNTTVHVVTVEFLDLPTSYVIEVANSQAVNNADATCPSIALVENRFRFVRYCSKFNIVFIHYGSYLHMLHESAY